VSPSPMFCHVSSHEQLLASLDSLVGRKASAPKGSPKCIRVQRASERRRATQVEKANAKQNEKRPVRGTSGPSYLVIHSIDSLTLRATAWRAVLERVASCEWVRLIASADTIASPACEP